MTRRGAIGLLSTIIAGMTTKPEAQSSVVGGSVTGITTADFYKPTHIRLRLADPGTQEGGWDQVTVLYNDRTVTLTAKEIFEALT